MALSARQIQKGLKEKGLTMSDIARELEISHTTVWKNVHKIRGATSRRVQDAIAEKLGRDRREIFQSAA